MRIDNHEYSVRYSEPDRVVLFSGSLRLNAAPEYQPITDLLDDALKRVQGQSFNWDLRELKFLNSSGINMLYQFVVKVRKLGDTQMQVRGSSAVPWQLKSLGNMTRFMPTLTLVLD